MEWLMTQCGALLSQNLPVLLSFILAGAVGSVAHCSVVCGPLSAASMLELGERRLPQGRMLAYHGGRIATYTLLGITANLAAGWLFSAHAAFFTHTALAIAGLLFILSAALPRKTHACCSPRTRGLLSLTQRLASVRLSYGLRGALMGFMPCGMLLAALMLAATLSHPATAAIGMAFFGLATTPMLHLAGIGAVRLNRRFPNFARMAGRGLMAANGLLLCGIGFNLVTMT